MRLFISLALLGFSINASAWTLDKPIGPGGAVKLEQKGHPVTLESGLKLTPGLRLTTSAEGKAHLADGESEIWVGPSTQLTFEREPDDDKDEKGLFNVGSGAIRVHFKQPSGPVSYPYEVKTRSLVASVRGTVFIVAVDAKSETVATIEGLVRVAFAKSAESYDVPANKGLFAVPKEMPKVKDLTKDPNKSLMSKWTSATTF